MLSAPSGPRLVESTTMNAMNRAAGATGCHEGESSLGSRYVALRVEPDTVCRWAESDLDRLYRRVVLDPLRGLVMLMSPSNVHEVLARHLDTTVEVMTDTLRLASSKLGSTRWRGPRDGRNTGVEPDCCFYLGDRAVAYHRALAKGEPAAEAYTLAHPPDLVVEVGVTRFDEEKQAHYGRLGVPELWRIDYDANASVGLVDVVFLALRPGREPRPLPVSAVLEGMRPEDVRAAVSALWRQGLDTAAERRSAIARTIEARRRAVPGPRTGEDRSTP